MVRTWRPGPSDKMSWYKGPTLLESLDAFQKAPSKTDRPFRMPVQAVYKFRQPGRRSSHRGGPDRIRQSQSGGQSSVSPLQQSYRSTIKSIEALSTHRPAARVDAGWSTGFTLTEEIFVTRGEIMAHESSSKPLVQHTIPGEPYLARQKTILYRTKTTRLRSTLRQSRSAFKRLIKSSTRFRGRAPFLIKKKWVDTMSPGPHFRNASAHRLRHHCRAA